MLDIRFIRDNVDYLKQVIIDKWESFDMDNLIQVDNKRIELQQKVDELNKQRNEAAKERNVELWKSLKDQIMEIEQEYNLVKAEFQKLMEGVPNTYSSDTPLGKDDWENVVLRKIGNISDFPFQPKEHWELWIEKWLLDIETASKVCWSRFSYIKWDLVKLQFAIVQFVFNTLTDESILKKIISENNLNVDSKPFVPVVPPVIIKQEVMKKMWRFEPKDERYCLDEDSQVFVWSAEHSLWPIHMNETIDEQNLPIRYIGYSTSFRREAWSYWKDVKWILRQHQFDKLEMESFALPEKWLDEQNFFVAIQEYLMQQLELPYQVLICCTWDMWTVDYRHIDIETWMPWQWKYRETHSSDYMTDYQSRRLEIRVKRKDWSKDFVHMNDATAFAIWRILIAIIENNQQQDWTIKVPSVLTRFVGKEII